MDKKDVKKIWSNWLIDIGANTTEVAKATGDTQPNLSKKINNGTIRLAEFATILEHYGYKLTISKK